MPPTSQPASSGSQTAPTGSMAGACTQRSVEGLCVGACMACGVVRRRGGTATDHAPTDAECRLWLHTLQEVVGVGGERPALRRGHFHVRWLQQLDCWGRVCSRETAHIPFGACNRLPCPACPGPRCPHPTSGNPTHHPTVQGQDGPWRTHARAAVDGAGAHGHAWHHCGQVWGCVGGSKRQQLAGGASWHVHPTCTCTTLPSLTKGPARVRSAAPAAHAARRQPPPSRPAQAAAGVWV